MEKILEVENLSKFYKDFQAVKDVNFNVFKGEIFALVGPNGAGKSTSLKMIATILNPSAGKIRINGIDTSKDSEEARKCISYLPEDAGAYKNLSGLDYLKFMASMYNDDKKAQKTQVDFAANLSNLGKKLKNKVKTYSKGMTRKLLLSRAIMTRPKLLILDEPTSGLDVINAVNVRDIIKNLSRQGVAVLLSSHNMLEVEYLSNRLAIIDKGEIKAEGKADDLKAKFQSQNLEEVFMKITK
ncbi:MAG: ABC transporter ATP-binding protein [Candidatus Pacebacteria bacterium]|nr:ABC transporter ATP-binding protein [Candidatus Paceibacterota bacterium]